MLRTAEQAASALRHPLTGEPFETFQIVGTRQSSPELTVAREVCTEGTFWTADGKRCLARFEDGAWHWEVISTEGVEE